MTEVRGPGVYEKIKVVFSFPSPAVAGAMIDARAMVLADMESRGQGHKASYDDAYYVEARDDEIWVWYEYEKPVKESG